MLVWHVIYYSIYFPFFNFNKVPFFIHYCVYNIEMKNLNLHNYGMDDQGHRRVPGHSLKFSYLRGGHTTKVTDKYLETHLNPPTYSVDGWPRSPMGT